MSKIGIIFDLDMTLVDTSSLESYRNKKDWNGAIANLAQTSIKLDIWSFMTSFCKFTEIAYGNNPFGPLLEDEEIFKMIKIGIVTSSPKKYAKEVISFHYKVPGGVGHSQKGHFISPEIVKQLDDHLVTYEDTRNHKPDPDPLLKGIKRMGLDVDKDLIITIGDRIDDILASKNIGKNLDQCNIELKGNLVEGPKLLASPGIFNVGVTWGGVKSSDLENAGAALTISAMADLEQSLNVSVFNELCNYLFTLGVDGSAFFQPIKRPELNRVIDEIYSLTIYIPTTANPDHVSKYLLSFKNGDPDAVRNWTRFCSAAFSTIFANRSYMADFVKQDCYIVRVLGHEETQSNGKQPLDYIIDSLAQANPSLKTCEDFLLKKRANRQLKSLPPDEKRAEIVDNYYINESSAPFSQSTPPSDFFIVDDILTTGTTALVVAEKINKHFPSSSITLLTLAETSRHATNRAIFDFKGTLRGTKTTKEYPTGSEYEGEWKDDRRHGKGTFTYPDGDKYVGEYKDGHRHGKGALTLSDGEKYVGEFKEGEMHGKGTLHYPDGSEYEGEWKDGERYDQGTKYVGEWKDYKRHGQGTMTWADGKKYEGEWYEGDMDGDEGACTYPDGSKYVGTWKENQRYGEGTCTYPDGSEYEGEWKDNLMHGQGTMTWTSHPTKPWKRYVGSWKNGKMEGHGVINHTNSNTYYKEFEKGDPINTNGKEEGICIYSNGDRYKGEFENDLEDGQGKKEYSNGDKYVGGWKEGKMHGQGTLKESNGIISKGEFVDGQFVK